MNKHEDYVELLPVWRQKNKLDSSMSAKNLSWMKLEQKNATYQKKES